MQELHELGYLARAVCAPDGHRRAIAEKVGRVVADLLDARDRGQHQPAARHPFALLKLLLHLVHQRRVQGRLLLRHLHGDDVLALFRQVVNNRGVRLHAPEDKRRREPLQPLAHLIGQAFVAPGLDRLGKVVAEKRLRAQHPRVHKVQQAAQLGQLIFNRGTRQRNAVSRGDRPHAFRRLRPRILNRLGLIAHHVIPLHPGQIREVSPDHAVGGNHQIRLVCLGKQLVALGPVRAVVDHHLHPRDEAGGLARPVAHDRGRGNHQRRPGAAARRLLYREQGEELQRLAQPHVVGKHCPEVVARHVVEPVHAATLVFAQLRVHCLGDVHALRGGPVLAADERGKPRRAGELHGRFRRRLERELAQLGGGHLPLGLVVSELLVARAGLVRQLAQLRGVVRTGGLGQLGARLSGFRLQARLVGRAALQPLHVLLGARQVLAVCKHPLAAQLDQAGLGANQLFHLLVGQLHIAEGDAPIVGDERVKAHHGHGGGIVRVLRAGHVQLRRSLRCGPRLGQHDGKPGLAQLRRLCLHEPDNFFRSEEAVPISPSQVPDRGPLARVPAVVHQLRDVDRRLDGLAQRLRGLGIEVGQTRGPRGVRPGAHLHAHGPLQVLRILRGVGVLRLVLRGLHEEHQLQVDRGNGPAPLVDLLHQRRVSAAQRSAKDQRCHEVVPRVGPDSRRHANRLQPRCGDPVRQDLREILAQVGVVQRQHAGGGGDHLRQPTALLHPGAQLPLRIPVPVAPGHVDGHPARAHELVQPQVRANQPAQIRGDRLALRLGAEHRAFVQMRQRGEELNCGARGKRRRRGAQNRLFALRRLQLQPLAAAKVVLAQQRLHVRRKRPVADGVDRDNSVARDLLNPNIEPGLRQPKSVEQVFRHTHPYTTPGNMPGSQVRSQARTTTRFFQSPTQHLCAALRFFQLIT